ncbi:nitrate ABC transporter substrate-binding protein [Streptomyces viridochromogenes]|uniref:Nitrate ABC transporter substrate-binding protein n=1 Tax=Streptomyces viridochromogenes TaxID=1938 RepID=A0A0J8CDR1_STRVR|nr:ABC transporter substrate-binding protein [Streptomyces viridochromogenes]KMS76050.1 nitrate ABC transporter substrate-binding protein [Streptomyces viridochromogenes]KOG07629.1 nitrate ABC transporter substrate-binding protein [Streptomyces viridochromogenes]KOG12770.1 nitrate ABC transporter substrate-binding protein [Streptomyces viridochromogenes]
MRRRSLGLAIAVVTVIGAAGCGSSSDETSGSSASDSGKTTQVKVGIIPIVDVAPLYLGQKKGFFSSRGIELKMESAQGGAAIIPGVVSGQFQFGFSNTTSLMIAQAKGVLVRSVANGAATTGNTTTDVTAVAVKENSAIKSARDLAGRTVAVNTLQNIGDTTVREAVRKDGGDPSKVKFVEIAFDQMPAALDGGQVDAAWMGEPALTIAKSQGARAVTSPFAETDSKLTVATYFTSPQLAKENPDLVKKFAEAMTESLTYASAHPDEARQILTTYTKIDGKVLKNLTLPNWPAQYDMASLEKLASLGEQDGLFGDKKPDLKTLFQ